MTEQLRRIDPSRINPNDFKGRTVQVEPVANPRKWGVGVVLEPFKEYPDGRHTTVIKLPHFLAEEPIEIAWETYLNGGEENGYRVPGILDEIDLVYNTQSIPPKFNPREEDLIAGLPRRLWMFP